MKFILFTLVFCFSCSFSQAQYLNELKLNHKTSFSDTVKSMQTLTEKSPFLAGTLSFIVPGLAFGQLYNEQPEKFFIHVCVTGASLLGAVLGATNLDIDPGGGGDGTGAVLFYISTGVFAGNWIWSVVDAVISANKINEQIKLQKSRSDVLDKFKFRLSLDKNKQLNLKFALEL